MREFAERQEKNLTAYRLLGDYLTRRYERENIKLTECCFGNKICDFGHWSNLCYSSATGWQQILYFIGNPQSENPQSEIEVKKICYYPSALSALLDDSIFPAGSMVWLR